MQPDYQKRIKALLKFQTPSFNKGDYNSAYSQWLSPDGRVFRPSRTGSAILPAGYYELDDNHLGPCFERISLKTLTLMEPQDIVSQQILHEIFTFWNAKEDYMRHGVPHKRGFLVHGVPGTGKSTLAGLVVRDVLDRRGVAVKFDYPSDFEACFKAFRSVQPGTPIAVIMEDLDTILYQHDESSVINVLDGLMAVDHVLFFATTNYLENISDRVTKRPGRFDRVREIKLPTEDERSNIVEELLQTHGSSPVPVEKLVTDTAGMSIAHVRELYIRALLLGVPYDAALEEIQVEHHS